MTTEATPATGGQTDSPPDRLAAAPLSEADLSAVVSGIGPRLRSLRGRHGLSLQQLADRSDVSPAAIHKVEQGTMVPTITTLLKLAAAFHVPVAHFIDESDTPATPVVYTAAKQRRVRRSPDGDVVVGSLSAESGPFDVAANVTEIAAGAGQLTRPAVRPVSHWSTFSPGPSRSPSAGSSSGSLPATRCTSAPSTSTRGATRRPGPRRSCGCRSRIVGADDVARRPKTGHPMAAGRGLSRWTGGRRSLLRNVTISTRSSNRFAYPHSLSYQPNTRTALPCDSMSCSETTHDRGSPSTSVETIGMSLTPMMPDQRCDSAAARKVCRTWSVVASSVSMHTTLLRERRAPAPALRRCAPCP